MPSTLRFAAFDLDGTVLDETSSPSARLADGVAALRAQGILPIVVTGRSPAEFRALAQDNRFAALWHNTVLLGNGDIEVDLSTATATVRNALPAGVLPRVTANGIIDVVAESAGRYVAFTRRAAVAFSMAYRFPRTEVAFSSQPGGLREVTRLTVFDDLATVTAALHDVPCRLDAGGPLDAITITPPDSCKATALAERLAVWFGETDLRHVVAFGNDINDACLIAGAGVGVAVAASHPAAAERATLHLSSGLVDFLLEGAAGLGGRIRHPVPAVACQRLCRRPS